MDYKPYSPEWHRKRYLKEALDKYLDDYVENDIIYNDLIDILKDRMIVALDEYNRADELSAMLQSK
jgi:hypothetical protein|tara:strand:+ start:281 stop:478 length:198 start_codon:yes stop_codon:yes gene_type:complete